MRRTILRGLRRLTVAASLYRWERWRRELAEARCGELAEALAAALEDCGELECANDALAALLVEAQSAPRMDVTYGWVN